MRFNFLLSILITALAIAAVAWAAQESAVLDYDDAGRLVRIVKTAQGTNTTEYFEYNPAGDLTFESRYAPGSENADYDGDGMTDTNEFRDFNTLAYGAADDFDGDRFGNLFEYLAGTLPTNPASYLGMETLSRSASGPVIRWTSVDGKSYCIERSTNLVVGAFSGIRSNILATPSMNTVTDTTAAGFGPWSYRVLLE
jgi:hypothetical protein